MPFGVSGSRLHREPFVEVSRDAWLEFPLFLQSLLTIFFINLKRFIFMRVGVLVYLRTTHMPEGGHQIPLEPQF